MDNVEEKIKHLEKQMRFNTRLFVILFLGVCAASVIVSITWGYILPLPKGREFLFESGNNKTILNSKGLTFYEKEQSVISLNLKERGAPRLELKHELSKAELSLFENGGGELAIECIDDAGKVDKRILLKVSSDEQEAYLNMKSFGSGEVRLGISKIGEPELILSGSAGGKIEMRVDSNGNPLIKMTDLKDKIIYSFPSLQGKSNGAVK